MRKLFHVVLLLGLLLAVSPAAAENRHIMQRYSFNEQGLLSTHLTIDFGYDIKTPQVEKISMGGDRSLLLITFPLTGDRIFTLPLFNSLTYSIYKANLRDSSYEELVVFGLGKVEGISVQVREVCIIGLNQAGEISAMPVKNFSQSKVRNVPMQLDGRRNIMLSADKSGRTYYIYWDPVAGEFAAGDRPLN